MSWSMTNVCNFIEVGIYVLVNYWTWNNRQDKLCQGKVPDNYLVYVTHQTLCVTKCAPEKNTRLLLHFINVLKLV